MHCGQQHGNAHENSRMKELKEKIKYLLRTLDSYSLYPVYYHFEMSKNEQKMFDKYIKRSKYYLEFGSGGSTLRALQRSKAKIYSVESSLDWIDYLNRYLIVYLLKNKRLLLYHADIGNTQDWGFPASDDSKNLFPNYSNGIFGCLNSDRIDTILIDGRFRVACVLNVILNLSSVDEPAILIHDFWNRENYHILLKYLTEIDSVETLGVFKIKNKVDIDSVKQDYNIYKYLPD